MAKASGIKSGFHDMPQESVGRNAARHDEGCHAAALVCGERSQMKEQTRSKVLECNTHDFACHFAAFVNGEGGGMSEGFG